MKVKRLKEIIDNLVNQEAEIVLSSDGEGNEFHEISEVAITSVYKDKISNFVVIGEEAIDLGGTKGYVIFPTG